MLKKILGAGILGILLILAVACVSMLCVCGIIKLICLCFGLAFSRKIAVGIWLVMILFNIAVKQR